ncbi:putative uncharacterized protein DDB_G0268590 [Anabrus simplex]|uniref:putative uncharacterized protein DDB_G0268590 n=1 Tax=Anabrus simplex TaxID=316456 RepID=UPI0035A2E7F9
MSLLLVLLPLMLAVSLASTDHCASSVGSKLDLSVHGHKNASGHRIITVDTRRLISTENQWELAVNVHQERRSCDSSEVEQLVSVTSVHPPVHGTSTSQYMKPVTPATTTPAYTTPPTTAITTAPTTTTPASTTTTTTTTTTAPTATTPPTTTITTTPTTTTPASSTTTAATTRTPTTSTTPTTTTTTTTTATTTATKPRSCPHSGYRLFEGFNCYKTYSGRKSWSDAREKCKRDGGDLMVSESERERREVFPTMEEHVSRSPWMGVYKPEGEDRWVSVKGEPAPSSWWLPGAPDNNAGKKCALAVRTGLLWNNYCTQLLSFICEIPL